MTAKMVIASAARLIDVRHVWRKRKRIAEMSVPACPIPTQKTKFVMSQAQPTGTLRPQIPIPSQKSHETATPRSPRSAREGKKKSHQPIGVFRSTGSATASVIEWKSGERRMSVGRPATGLSSSSNSVWAKRVCLVLVRRVACLYHRASRQSSVRRRAYPCQGCPGCRDNPDPRPSTPRAAVEGSGPGLEASIARFVCQPRDR